MVPIVLRFDDGTRLQANYWRIIENGIAIISSFDHQKKYGLPGPLDAIKGLQDETSDKTITQARVDKETGDLVFEFTENLKLEVFNFTGYEIWTIQFPDGTGEYSNYVLEPRNWVSVSKLSRWCQRPMQHPTLPTEVEEEVGALVSELIRAGWKLSGASYKPQMFGNWIVELQRDGSEIRLVKDKSQYYLDGPPRDELQTHGLWRAFIDLSEFRSSLLEWVVGARPK